MSVNYDKYEIVVGLEVHAQLLTQTKLFCGDSASFGGEPNTHVSPITLGHPGTLPKLNKKAVEFAVKMGLACHCEIERHNYFARKNYFYPDLPKGYQISQHTTPICKGGYVTIKNAAGEKKVLLNRIHLEEDAGKSLHDVDPDNTCIDYNRAGVPLIEIVTEPDIRSSDEAYAYLTELRKILRYTEVCDGNMEEGSMRCDANVSIRLKGETKLGTKVEVKNLNSIRNVKRAIEFETKRMIDLVESGEKIIQQTRSFDATNGTTFTLRTKEEANDYRYFADPDLTPFHITDSFLQEIKNSIPPLPEELVTKYTKELMLPEYDARVICDDKETAGYFELLITETTNYKAAANWMLGPIKSYLNENGSSITDFPVPAKTIGGLIQLVDEGKVNFSIASTRILPVLIKDTGKTPLQIATELNLIQNSDESSVLAWVEEALAKMPDKVTEYKKGKKGLIGLFVGEVKKISKGKADPKLTNQLLLEKLNN
ncbi:MAG: Asp-tRNA(Asn)/Glu-tRNA(Gln) amidotransferase subunit GatB [Bacteroidetes bacterium]|nr:Asp-tRNA(Asn)/Glu-tRNA(Gln) amidotransferase subunit GatB [Bacteroidota bacterium]MBS1933185.1 Asp-tRNA(Asn)/Glu-tRNA(Gln) amidotransferase subunit GatB [Bacteroidota bacterium]